jgi:serine-type D-Ala-D-Ala carboxypeptidase/endopeptidase (penicillin-binding protein 4)
VRAKPRAILIGLSVVLWVSALGVGGYAVFSKLSDGASVLGNGPSASPTPTPTPTPTRTRPPASPVLGGVGGSTSTGPTQAGLAAALSGPLSADSLGSHVGVAVRDVATGELLYGKGPDAAYAPASTTKIVTVAAALQAFGPQHRFSTTVVQGAEPGSIVLVGGGDPLLATKAAWARRGQATADRRFPVPATIDDLAAQAAKQLKAGGLTEVPLAVDDTLFEEAVSPDWEPTYVSSGVAARVMALWVNEARLDWPSNRPRASDPALSAAEAFAAALESNGVKVSGSHERGAAPSNAKPIASVESPPLADIAEHVLLTSDNDGAEVLAHQVAVAQKQPATFAGASAGIQAVLKPLGVAVDELDLDDGSGLARSNRLTPAVLTQVLALAASPDHPKLRAVLTGLPVAGFSGTLDERFGTDSAQPGVGVVRAKTGTLSGISTLSGVVTTKDGDLLAFAAMADQRNGWAEPALDRVAAALATCGCR